MPKKPSVSFHRHLIREAWELVWQRRPLWVLGFFGGLVLSGTTIEPAFSGLARVVHLGTFWMQARANDWAEATVPFGNALRQVCRFSPAVTNISVTAFIVLAVLFVVFLFLCQGGLITGLAERKPMSVPDTLRRGWIHAWSVFIIGLLARAYQLILFLLVSLPILFYLENPGWRTTFAACLAILLYLPLAIAGNTIGVFASIHAVHKQTTVPEAFEVGARLFLGRWLEAFETGLILVVLSALSLIAFAAALIVAAIPVMFLYATVRAGGWFLGMGLAGAVGILAFCVALFMFAGLLSAFRLAVWLRFYERALHPVHGPRIVARLKRWFHPAHVK